AGVSTSVGAPSDRGGTRIRDGSPSCNLFGEVDLVGEEDLLVLFGGLVDGQGDLVGGHTPAAVVAGFLAIDDGLVELLELLLAAGVFDGEGHLALAALFVDPEAVGRLADVRFLAGGEG